MVNFDANRRAQQAVGTLIPTYQVLCGIDMEACTPSGGGEGTYMWLSPGLSIMNAAGGTTTSLVRVELENESR